MIPLLIGLACVTHGTSKPDDSVQESGAPDTGDSHSTDSDSTETADTAEPPCDRSLPWRFVECGLYQTCGIHTDGCAECWGRGEAETTPPDDTGGGYHWWGEDLPPPGDYASISMVRSLYDDPDTPSACGLLTDGSTVCWGRWVGPDFGPPDTPLLDIAMWEEGAFAVTAEHGLVEWGVWSDEPPPGEFSAVEVGSGEVALLDLDGAVHLTNLTWSIEQPSPVGAFRQISEGARRGCGIRTDGSVLCWNPDDPENAEFEKMTLEAPSSSVTEVCVTGWEAACAILDGGEASCWPDAGDYWDPPAGETFSQLACGSSHVCGLTPDGRIVCWGDDYYGETIPPS